VDADSSNINKSGPIYKQSTQAYKEVPSLQKQDTFANQAASV